MSSGSPSPTIRLSVLDRLLDDEPDANDEVPLDENQKLRILQAAVRRDLQNLLNTRYRCIAWPPELSELDDSLINYGIPDFTASSLNAAQDSDILINAIRKAITLFEPRLSELRIEHVAAGDYSDRTFRFRMEAILQVGDIQQRIRFDSSLEAATGKFDVR